MLAKTIIPYARCYESNGPGAARRMADAFSAADELPVTAGVELGRSAVMDITICTVERVNILSVVSTVAAAVQLKSHDLLDMLFVAWKRSRDESITITHKPMLFKKERETNNDGPNGKKVW